MGRSLEARNLNRDELNRLFGWLTRFGANADEVARLLPTLPGGMTSANSYYVNSLIPDVIFRGREQATLPMTSGRWYLIPLELIDSHPPMRAECKPVAVAPSMLPLDGPREIAEWPTG